MPSNAAQLSTDDRILHVLNRLSFGPHPGDIEWVQSIGVEQYIKAQLHPDAIPESAELTARLEPLETLNLSTNQLLQQYRIIQSEVTQQLGDRPTNEVMEQATQAKLLRAILSPRQLEEVMVDFWYNHFNVSADKGLDRYWVGAYERDAIRPYALGKFRDLLSATAKHPAMLFYLDNWVSRISPKAAEQGKFDDATKAMQLALTIAKGLNNFQKNIALSIISAELVKQGNWIFAEKRLSGGILKLIRLP
jgi:uncharacterized protein (DUF1800 family)